MARNYSSVVEPKTLTANVGTSDVQITLNNVTGLPSAPYVLVLNPDTVKEEAVLVTVDQTGVTSPTLKVERAIEARSGLGTAQTHSVGNIVKHMIVGSDMQIVHDHFSNDNTTTGTAHGATGGVVGRTNSQTLTNKTVNLADNTLTGTKAQFNAALSDADFATIGGTETLTDKTLTSPVINGGTLNGGAALTVDSTELNKLDGVTTTAAQLNYINTTTSNVQSQLNSVIVKNNDQDASISSLNSAVDTKLPKAGGTITGNLTVNSNATFDAVVYVGADNLRVDGDIIRPCDGGQGTVSVTSGVQIVSHSLGKIPSAVTCTQRTSGTISLAPRIFVVTDVSSSTFSLYALDTAGNRQTGAFWWTAVG